MIERYDIEKAVEEFISGPDLDIDDIKSKDTVVMDAICMRMNYLKHRYLRSISTNSGEAEKTFERMCQIIPGFMLLNGK